jgi:hypothetical protein
MTVFDLDKHEPIAFLPMASAAASFAIARFAGSVKTKSNHAGCL